MLLARFTHLLNTLNDYQKRHRSRQRLLVLDERLLKDIGLSHADAQREGNKPFWKA